MARGVTKAHFCVLLVALAALASGAQRTGRRYVNNAAAYQRSDEQYSLYKNITSKAALSKFIEDSFMLPKPKPKVIFGLGKETPAPAKYAAAIAHDHAASLENPLGSLVPLLSHEFHLYVFVPITNMHLVREFEATRDEILALQSVKTFLNEKGGQLSILPLAISAPVKDRLDSLGNVVPFMLDFWLRIQERKVLYFQWDVAFCNNSGTRLETYLDKYDFVGAPWDTPQRVGGMAMPYGNGGLTIRDRDMMIFCLMQPVPDRRRPESVFNEDMYFSHCLRAYSTLFVAASTEVAQSFSAEEIPTEDVMGLHDICRANPCVSRGQASALDIGRVKGTVQTRNQWRRVLQKCPTAHWLITLHDPTPIPTNGRTVSTTRGKKRGINNRVYFDCSCLLGPLEVDGNEPHSKLGFPLF